MKDHPRLLTSKEPFLQIWLSNFFEPFYSDRSVMRKSIEHIKALGFNTVNLDSKPWEDFFARYNGEPASTYVAIQEFMLGEMKRVGLNHTFLALYLCGDNLYPNIRDVPPVRGEESIGTDGKSLNTYKYWSPKTQDSMVEHVAGVLRLYGERMATYAQPEPNRPIQTMFEPVLRPSFDPEGRERYLGWLEARYEGLISLLNRRYELQAGSFRELQPEQYWLRPAELGFAWGACPTAGDFAEQTPDLWRWIDNQTWLAEETVAYFKTMKKRFRSLDPSLMIEPGLHQWGYFFNPPESVGWQTGLRALDIHKLAPHLDNALIIAAPLNSEGMPDAGVLSVEYSIARSVNGFKPFTAGLYLGRHVSSDIYRHVTPAEAYATFIAAGASGVHVYGYSGLDDGGVFCMMDDMFLESVETGNRWARQVIPLIDPQKRLKEAAILFPSQMNLLEPVSVGNGIAHHMDLLGWHQQLLDLGYHVDILHPDQITEGTLADYHILAVPHNSCYHLSPNPALEKALRDWVGQGGLLFHGPSSTVIQNTFGVQEYKVELDCIDWQGHLLIPHGWSTVAYTTGKAISLYARLGTKAITELIHGKGKVISMGFEYGHAYSRKSMPAVPPSYCKLEAHPIVLLKETPVGRLALERLKPRWPGRKGVEIAQFGDRLIVVNHRSEPVNLAEYQCQNPIFQIESTLVRLTGHSAVCLQLAKSLDFDA